MAKRYKIGTVRVSQSAFGVLIGGQQSSPLPVGRKTDWPTNEKTFRTKRDAEDWARRTEDEMVRGVYIQHCGSERM